MSDYLEDILNTDTPNLGSQQAYDLNLLGPGGTSMADEYRTYGQLYPGSTGSGILDTLLASAKSIGKGLISPRGLFGLAGLLASYLDRDKTGRMGEKLNLSPSKVTKEIVPGKYGPISLTKFAADGGLMQAYATGGVLTGTKQNPLQMEDGAFVLTKRAMDGANRMAAGGITQVLPGTRLIAGRGTGTSDDVPATIGGTTPAAVSNGEGYVPKAVVDQAGGARALYALMRQLERRA